MAIPGSREKVKAYKGTIVQVPLQIVEKGLLLEWRYAGLGTVHRHCQLLLGHTVWPSLQLLSQKLKALSKQLMTLLLIQVDWNSAYESSEG